MASSLLTDLANELARVLPLVQALSEVETKEAAAQAKLKDTLAALARAEREAAQARRSADDAIVLARTDLAAKTTEFKEELVQRHADATREFDTLHAESKAARLRWKEEVVAHKVTLAGLHHECEQAQRELDGLTARLATAKAEFAKALTGVAG